MKSICVRIAIAILSMTIAANATVLQTFTDQTTFTNATSGISAVNFAAAVVGNYYNAAGVTVSGVTFVGFDGVVSSVQQYSLAVLSPGAHVPWGTQVLRGGNGSLNGSYIQFNLLGATAVAMRLASFWEGNPVKVTLSTGESYTVNTPNVAPAAFWGFTSDAAVTFVRISTINQSGSPVLVDLQYGTANAPEPPPPETPEVATMLTIGIGLFAIHRLKRGKFLVNPTPA